MQLRALRPDWELTPLVTAPAPKRRGARRAAVPPLHELPPALLPEGAEVVSVTEARPQRGDATPLLDVEVQKPGADTAVLVVRHASGALSFHAPVAVPAQRGTRAKGAASLRFSIPVAADDDPQRGLLGKVLKLILVKVKHAVIDALTEKVLKTIARTIEQRAWKKKALSEGLFRLSVKDGRMALKKISPAEVRTGRSLLFIHGTFSNTEAAFGALAGSGLFDTLDDLYDGRIYALQHFSVSRTPLENAQALLKALPDRRTTFDVITHSRGGLVLRSLSELQERLGDEAQRFELGTAVLVAAPNQGTPLATPARWEKTMGVLANVLEVFPDNPLTTAAEFIANGITWLAKHVVADLPGLASMDANGPFVSSLQQADEPGTGEYWCLAANHEPDDNLWKRLVDIGVDAFFAGANDMVVPCEGSWLADGAGTRIPAERIACFGPGGNLADPPSGAVHHSNFFAQRDTVRYIRAAFGLEKMPLTPIDPSSHFPTQRGRRGGGTGERSFTHSAPAASEHERVTSTSPPPGATYQAEVAHLGRTLELFIFGQTETRAAHEQRKRREQDLEHVRTPFSLIASYGGATVVEDFKTKNKHDLPGAGTLEKWPVNEKGFLQWFAHDGPEAPGVRFSKIIEQNRRIRARLDGDTSIPLPTEDQLRSFGDRLFKALFTGDVKRLYDVARSRQDGKPLNVILTSNLPWVAALPWEFAFDTSRQKFLATEEVNFIRNVVTAVPAQKIVPIDNRLRVLLVPAQPSNRIGLEVAEEEMRMRAGLKRLMDRQLLDVKVLKNATPAELHKEIQTGPRYDVVHFMGHAGFDREIDEGRLLLLNRDGGEHAVDITALRGILCNRGIHLVFLNACETGRDSEKREGRGVAQSLIQGGIPGVVANQYNVLDSAAVTYSEHFYLSLANGDTFADASREARIALNYRLDDEVIDWAIPMLYTQDPDFRLVKEKANADRITDMEMDPQTRTGRTDARRGSRPKATFRVAVADLARQFVHLDRALGRLNEAQDVFHFEHVELAVPMGVWQTEGGAPKKGKKSEEETTEAANASKRYLLATEFAKRVKGQIKALNADFLLCSTDQIMRVSAAKADARERFSWCDPKENVALFSTYLQNDLGQEGHLAGRVAANAIAEGLAGCVLARRIPTYKHSSAPRTCPLHEAPGSHMLVRDRLRFDAICKQRILRHAPTDKVTPQRFVDALEKLLRVYDEPVV